MQLSQSKFVFKLALIGGAIVNLMMIWLLISANAQHLDVLKSHNRLHVAFAPVQQSYAALLAQKGEFSRYQDALAQFAVVLEQETTEKSSALVSAVQTPLAQQMALLVSEIDTSESVKLARLSVQHENLVKAFVGVSETMPNAQWQTSIQWGVMVLLTLLLWAALLYSIHRKLNYRIELTARVLASARQLQAYRLPEHLKGNLVAEPQVLELLAFIDVLANRLEQVHARFIQEAQEATLGSLTQGFSQSIQQTIKHAAVHQKRLNTIVNKLNNADITPEQESQLFTKSQLILAQLDGELANIYELLCEFEQISDYHQFDIEVEFNLKQLVESVFSRHQQELSQEQFHISYEIPDTLLLVGSPAIFEQIYHHCISNSIRHAKRADSALHIVVSAMVINDFVHLYFKDDGVGIDSELLPILAKPALNSRQHFGKFGLGLSVIYHLVTDKLKGELKVQSPAHGGACIHIVLESTLFKQVSAHDKRRSSPIHLST